VKGLRKVTRRLRKVVGILPNFIPGTPTRIQIRSVTDFANFITKGPVWLRFALRMCRVARREWEGVLSSPLRRDKFGSLPAKFILKRIFVV
jgi:hypothetical protein